MTNEKFTELATKQKKLSYLVSSIVSILNLIILFQTIAALWGIKITIYAPKITREYLLQYEYYIRILVTSMMILLVIDNYVFNYYKKKYGTEPPREYGIAVSFYVMFISLLAYYVYQIWTFLYFSVLGAFSLTYYLVMKNPYLDSLRRSKFIKEK